ncbi:MAG: disulfide bond formation protein B [Methyloversatilis discipulorum]|jgi:disulfide bond formation protein DsbB|uniref:disulfide bond formation protein B n=1 Tax=Methyloversatilis discipulorum TaxID=1119528 RepID=UPI0026EED6A1|nr:disulfide bond formation protein B [Methyloversatilis discipulorum]MBV5287461.1 disulfide bond formation protein B [Methyloversatilis discipulorum]
MTPIVRTRIYFLLSYFCFGLLAFALWLQHVERLAPCPLCILQRYAFFGAGVFFLLSGLFGGALARSGLWVSALIAAAGAAVAGRHVYVLYNPSVSCGLDPVEDFVNSLPPAQWFPQAFFADGACGAKLPPILGLDIPEWSLLWLSVLAVVAVLLSLRRG